MSSSVRLRWCPKSLIVSFVLFSTAINVKHVEGQFLQVLDNFDSCQAARIPCGGHTQSSCSNYCTSSGYSQGMCDGSCCLCSQKQTDAFTRNANANPLFGGNGMFFNSPGNTLNMLQKNMQQNMRINDFNPFADLFVDNDLTKNTFLGDQIRKSDVDDVDIDIVKNNNVRKDVQRHKPKPAQKTCTTTACHDEAQAIKSQMDEGVDPCDDFYTFACGGFIRKNKIAQDQVDASHFTNLRDKVTQQVRKLLEEGVTSADPKPFRLVKNMYRSCMNTASIEKQGFKSLSQALEAVGGWPVLEGSKWKPLPEFTWQNFAVWFKELGFSMDYFVRISVEPDSRNTARRNLVVAEPQLGLSEHVLRRGLNEPSVNSYYNYMVEMAELLGANRLKAKDEMLKAANLEVSISQCFHIPDRRTGKFYYPMSIQDMSTKYPAVPWLELFQRIMPSTVRITNSENIMVSAEYLDCFTNLISRTDKRTLANYAVWRVVSASAPFLTESARSVQHRFLSTITGQKVRKPRWMECTEVVSSHLLNAVGAMYIRRHFPESSKTQATEMVHEIRNAFIEIMEEADWMDVYTKMKAREKATAMQIHVGYPEEHKSDAKLTTLYSQFDFTSDDYFDNVRKLIIGATNLAFGKLRLPIQRGDWSTHGKNAVVNAFYIPLENAIQLPAAILQGHFFNATRPNYLNFGAIGWIIGHELTHGFDDQGHMFGKYGNHKNWWADTTKTTFNSKKQCVIDQYSGFQSKSTGLKISGDRTQGENIADNGGIKQAYRGYQNWLRRNGGVEKGLPDLDYAPSQLFWIAAAQNWCSSRRVENLKHIILTDEHAPSEFRVRGTFANNQDFANDFQCLAGRRMNPSRKCSVW